MPELTDMRINCCMEPEEPQKEITFAKTHRSRLARLFTLRKKEEEEDNENDKSDDEGSIKDLFNF